MSERVLHIVDHPGYTLRIANVKDWMAERGHYYAQRTLTIGVLPKVLLGLSNLSIRSSGKTGVTLRRGP